MHELHITHPIHFRCTPLYAACWCGHTAVARHLMEHGADVNIRDDDDRTCLHAACCAGHADAALALLDEPRQDQAPSASGPPSDGEGEADGADAHILCSGIDERAVTKDGLTAFALACRHDKPAVVKALLRWPDTLQRREDALRGLKVCGPAAPPSPRTVTPDWPC